MLRDAGVVNQKPSRLLPELIVGGVIVLIVAVFVTRLYNRSAAQANRVTCMNNINQLGRAMSMYSSDCDERLPLGPAWQDGVMSYVAKPPDWSVYFCPARGNEHGYSYGLNSALGGLPDQHIQTPSETILLVDVRNSTREVWWANDIRFLTLDHNRTPDPCHLGRANFAYCDGHVESRDPYQMTTDNWLVTVRK